MNYFDRYTIKARIQPVFLSLLPLTVVAMFLYPQLYESWKSVITGLALTSGILMFFSNVIRYFGVKIQDKLFRRWGGAPTTRWLRHRDKNIDPLTKARYHNFLLQKVPGLTFPTKEEEKDNPDLADDAYKSAIAWLIEHARDKERFPLIFEENINYGFRRNMFAIKNFAIFISYLSLSIIALNNYYSSNNITIVHSIILTAVSLTTLYFWIYIVSDDWVKEASNAYTKRLLASCDMSN